MNLSTDELMNHGLFWLPFWSLRKVFAEVIKSYGPYDMGQILYDPYSMAHKPSFMNPRPMAEHRPR